MKNKIIIIILGIFLIGLVNAIYAGECMEIDLSELDNSKDIFYIVVGNSSNLDGMNITLNNNASVCFAINYKPDNFTLIFFNQDKEKEIIVEHHYSGGGGSSRTIYKENKTIEYVEIPTYIDREVMVENKTESVANETEESSKGNKGLIIGIIIAVFLIIGGIIFLIILIRFKEQNI